MSLSVGGKWAEKTLRATQAGWSVGTVGAQREGASLSRALRGSLTRKLRIEGHPSRVISGDCGCPERGSLSLPGTQGQPHKEAQDWGCGRNSVNSPLQGLFMSVYQMKLLLDLELATLQKQSPKSLFIHSGLGFHMSLIHFRSISLCN